MVQAHSFHSRNGRPRTRLDAQRIGAGAGAIAFNVGLLFLLLVPVSTPQWRPEPVRPEVTWIEALKPRPVQPVPAPVVPQPPQPRTTPEVVPRATPPVAPTLPGATLSDSMPLDLPATNAANHTDPRSTTALAAAPRTGVQLRYAKAPPPAYPRRALQRGHTGTVLLEVLVDTDGRPLEVRVSRSSGDRDLDRAARQQVLDQWRFEPAIMNGQAVQALGIVPIAFSMD